MLASGPDAITLAYEAHAGELRRFAARQVRDVTAAEDIVQDAYLRLAVEVAAGRPPEQPRAWLYRVISNLIVSRGRHLAVASRHAAHAAPAPTVEESPESHYLRSERSRTLLDAMLDVAPDGRSGLVMVAQGYTGREIARALGRNELATRALLHRARRKARSRLTSDDPELGLLGLPQVAPLARTA